LAEAQGIENYENMDSDLIFITNEKINGFLIDLIYGLFLEKREI